MTMPPAPAGEVTAPCSVPASMMRMPTAMMIKAILLRLILDHQHDKEDYDPEDEQQLHYLYAGAYNYWNGTYHDESAALHLAFILEHEQHETHGYKEYPEIDHREGVVCHMIWNVMGGINFFLMNGRQRLRGNAPVQIFIPTFSLTSLRTIAVSVLETPSTAPIRSITLARDSLSATSTLRIR